MKNRQNQQERGQAIVIVAFAIIAVAAMVGLAIDGGNLYALRRRAQIGADSAAMAGTRVLADLLSDCTNDASRDVAIRAEIVDFARNNGIDHTLPNGEVTAWYVNKDQNNIGPVGAGAIPNGATGIRVTVVATETTSFMRLFGFESLVAPGEALALTGRVTQFAGGGLLPIAVPEIVIRDYEMGDPFTVLDGGAFKEFCVKHPDMCAGETASSAQRGWLQLAHIFNNDPTIMARGFTCNTSAGGKCSDPITNAGLDRFIYPECPYPHPVYAGRLGMDDGDFILGMTGGKASGFDELQAWVGQTGYMPVFDMIFSGTKGTASMDTMFSPKVPEQHCKKWDTGTSSYYYHIVGFVAAEITNVNKGAKTVSGNFVTASIKAGNINPSEGFTGGGSMCQKGLMGIMLVD